MQPGKIRLDPQKPVISAQELIIALNLSTEDIPFHRLIALLPRSTAIYLDESIAQVYGDLPLADKFTFDTERDELILFSADTATVIDALIEMAMYMTGFATMISNEDTWIVQFTIGAWKVVRNRIKREQGIDVPDQPRAIVGLPPAPDQAPPDDPYPFRTFVSRYNYASFHQMIVLAACDDIAVYFPPESHHKVLAVYTYTRRAMQKIGSHLTIADFQTFNTRLLREIQRIEQLFTPEKLLADDVQTNSPNNDTSSKTTPQLGMFPQDAAAEDSHTPPTNAYDPFEAFIEQLFPDDESDTNQRES